MSTNAYENCPHIVNDTCFVCSSIAKQDVPIDSNVCANCTEDPYRPQRLNIYTMNHLLRYNPSVDEASLLKVISGEGEGLGKALAITFSMLERTANCKCNGLEDILNVWTPEYIKANLDSIITQLEIEARNRSLTFSRLLAKVLLRGLLVVTSPTQE